MSNIEALKGITFGCDGNSANNFDEHCDIINNYSGSELKIGADMLQEFRFYRKLC